MDSQAEANVPFVSAGSWRRWLRDTLIEETGLKPSTIRVRGNTDKIGSERNPIEYIEDDVFGYMYPISKADMAAIKKAEDEAVIETETEAEDDEAETTETETKVELSTLLNSMLRLNCLGISVIMDI